VRVGLFLITMFLAGYTAGHVYGTTEEDAYEQPWRYPDEPAEYLVVVRYRNQTLRFVAKSYREVLAIAKNNPGAVIIYKARQNKETSI